MKGTWPTEQLRSDIIKTRCIHLPLVATALNKPLAILSISSSICCSVDEGELRIEYVDTGPEKVG